MARSPIRSTLYRSAQRAVIGALVALSIAPIPAQVAKKNKQVKGPRALGLLELSSDGRAHLIPIAIMVDGKFYDAGAYKASPVPQALWSDTVYEGEKTGVPQGLFTVGGALQRTPGTWLAEGKWRPAGSEPKTKKLEPSKPRMGDEDEGPPKLRRGDSGKPDAAKTSPPPPTPSAEDKKTPSSSPAPDASSPQGEATSKDNPPAVQQPTAPSPDANDEDPNRPILTRGKPETQRAGHPQVGGSTGVPRRPAPDLPKPDTGLDPKSEAKKTKETIPAISDANGPEPRPYAYDIKPAEEQKYRKGMLALAVDALLSRLKEMMPTVPGAKPAPRTSARRSVKSEPPTFDDVHFRAFDLWNTNEPVFVLSATAHMPRSAADSANPAPTYYVTLVAKNNIYDELRKLYVGVTDDHHLDETPRFELIDAVDADGDGRGELLFRRISDAGSSWGVYRAGADQLFPLFEGTPGQ
jgi:hypothetical protein